MECTKYLHLMWILTFQKRPRWVPCPVLDLSSASVPRQPVAVAWRIRSLSTAVKGHAFTAECSYVKFESAQARHVARMQWQIFPQHPVMVLSKSSIVL